MTVLAISALPGGRSDAPFPEAWSFIELIVARFPNTDTEPAAVRARREATHGEDSPAPTGAARLMAREPRHADACRWRLKPRMKTMTIIFEMMIIDE